MLTRLALAPVVFGLLVACTASPVEGEEEETAQTKQELRRSGRAATCECTLEAGDNVWRCNGACSDDDLANLPH